MDARLSSKEDMDARLSSKVEDIDARLSLLQGVDLKVLLSISSSLLSLFLSLSSIKFEDIDKWK